MSIPVVGVVDTNCDPDMVDYVIPGNDDALRAIRLFSSRIADAVLEGKQIALDKQFEAEKLAAELPSSVSKDYGKPFADIFKEYEYDFFKIDPMLFSPASVIVSAVESGRSFHAGGLDIELLEKSFGG